MKSDFDLIARHFDEDIRIIPVSDVHLGAAEHLKHEWDDFCGSVLKKPNTYLLLGGDLINNNTRSSVGLPWNDTIRPREQKRIMCDMLEPLRDRILCAVSGNHERRSGKDADDDPMYDIMCKLDLEDVYRENMAFMVLRFGDQASDGCKNPTYTICVTHGAGGGMLTGGAVNRAERFGYTIDNLDCLVLGHTHKPYVTQPSKILIDARNNRVSFKPIKVISMTSWLAYGGYAAQKMMLPSSYAPQEMLLHRKYKQIDVTM